MGSGSTQSRRGWSTRRWSTPAGCRQSCAKRAAGARPFRSRAAAGTWAAPWSSWPATKRAGSRASSCPSTRAPLQGRRARRCRHRCRNREGRRLPFWETPSGGSGKLLEDRGAVNGDQLELVEGVGLDLARQGRVLQVPAVSLAIGDEPLEQVGERLPLVGVGLGLLDEDPAEAGDR